MANNKSEELDLGSLLLEVSRLESILEQEGLSKNLANKIRNINKKACDLYLSITKEEVIKGFLRYIIENIATLTSPHQAVKGTARNDAINQICKILNKLQLDKDYIGPFQHKYVVEYKQYD